MCEIYLNNCKNPLVLLKDFIYYNINNFQSAMTVTVVFCIENNFDGNLEQGLPACATFVPVLYYAYDVTPSGSLQKFDASNVICIRFLDKISIFHYKSL